VQDRNLYAEPDVKDRPIWAVLQGAGLSGHPDIQHDDKQQKKQKRLGHKYMLPVFRVS
jgi:hypothetical protein